MKNPEFYSCAGYKLLRILVAAILVVNLEICRSEMKTAPTRDSVCEEVPSGKMIACLQSQVSDRPYDPRIWLSLGKLFHEQGHITEAKLSYKSVINLSPLSFLAAEAYLHRGIIHQTDGYRLPLIDTIMLFRNSRTFRSRFSFDVCCVSQVIWTKHCLHTSIR
jgi:hypothetical protein